MGMLFGDLQKSGFVAFCVLALKFYKKLCVQFNFQKTANKEAFIYG